MLHRFGHFELDTAALTLREHGRLVQLPRKAVEVLALLVERSGCVVTKQEVMDALWPDGFVEDGNLTQQIYLLRRAFREKAGWNPIETIPRRGYCFNAMPAARARCRSFPLAQFARTAAAILAMLFMPASAMLISQPQHLEGEALRAYTLGRYFWNLRSVAAMTRSISYFKSVVALAPRSALGYAGLADAYTELADFENPCAECAAWRRRAQVDAARAIEVDPSSAEAHIAFGMVRRLFSNDDRTAAREFRTALQIDPGNALANQWYGNMLIAQGSTTEGVRRLQLAAAGQPISTATYAWLARGYYYEHRYGDAARYAREALQLEPTRLETMVLLGFVQEARGHFSEARQQFQNAARAGAAPEETQALKAGLNAAMGRRAAALAALERISARRNVDVYTSRDLVIGLAMAGDAGAARDQLARIRYPTPLDKQLILQDPHIRPLAHSAQ